MTDLRKRILSALDIPFEEISESRLVDILIDEHEAAKATVSKLKAENADEREALRQERETIRVEMRKMRSEPLYCAAGEFYFVRGEAGFLIVIQGTRINLFEHSGAAFYPVVQVSSEEWNKHKIQLKQD